MSTRWAKCSAPDSVGRQANSRAALPSFFCSSVGLLSIPLAARRLPHSVPSHARVEPPAPVLKRHSCVSRALSRIPIEQLPLFFSKQSLPLRGLCFFLVLPCGFVQMHRGSSSRSLRSISLFSRLPTCVARLPAVQRDVSKKSRVIIPKNVEQSGKTRRLFPDYSAVSRLFLRRRAAYPLYILNLCEEGKHRVPILCINFAAFFPFRPRANYRGAHFVYILTAFTAHSTTKHIHRAHYHNYLKIHNPKYPHVVIVHARYCI